MIPRVVATPLAGEVGGALRVAPRRVAAPVLDACLPGPGLDRLKAGEAAVVTTGQQPVLFTGPIYTIYKALTAVALARRLERELRYPVVPVFWVAGDDHDLAEANHVHVLDREGELKRVALSERAAGAALTPLAREPLGPEVIEAVDAIAALAPGSEFAPPVVECLRQCYRPGRSVADAFADLLKVLLGPLGLVVFRPYAASAKAAAAPTVVAALRQARDLDAALASQGGEPPVPVGKGETLVFLDGPLGRDRVVLDGTAAGLMTRRGGERYGLADLEALARTSPERLSANVLLRPVVEAALWPTAAYVGGPGEFAYLPQAEPVYTALGVARQHAVARWSGLLVEARVEKVMTRHGLSIADFEGPEGALERRIVRDELSGEAQAALNDLRGAIEQGYARVLEQVGAVDPTLERPAVSARNAALAATRDLERKLVAHLKRSNETLVHQLRRARAGLYPLQQPQERVLGYVSFAVRYGPALLEGLREEVERWVDTLALEAVPARG